MLWHVQGLCAYNLTWSEPENYPTVNQLYHNYNGAITYEESSDESCDATCQKLIGIAFVLVGEVKSSTVSSSLRNNYAAEYIFIPL